MQVAPVAGSPNEKRFVIDNLVAGWNTRSFPTNIPENALYNIDNCVYTQDGLISKRPGNSVYNPQVSSGSTTGTGKPITCGFRVYFPGFLPITVVLSGEELFWAYDGGYYVALPGFNWTGRVRFAQMYDPDALGENSGATSLIIVDATGTLSPVYWTGPGTVLKPFRIAAWATGSGLNALPNDAVSGNPIAPKFVCVWGPNLVFAGTKDDPGALFISDALRPQRFNGYSLEDTGGTTYLPYYPGGRSGDLGATTGIIPCGPCLLNFLEAGIVTVINTGNFSAFEYQFSTISTGIGNTSPDSPVSFGNVVLFFGGDRFYATDAQYVYPLPDVVPTLYQNSDTSSGLPCDIANKFNVAGGRRGQTYWAMYQSANSPNGSPDRIATFNMSANGGVNLVPMPIGVSTGGAWTRWPSGMPCNWMIECRKAGDTFQVIWGHAQLDCVAQHDPFVTGEPGYWADFGEPIAINIQTKNFSFGFANAPKTLHTVSPVIAYAPNDLYTYEIEMQAIVDGQMLDLNPYGAALELGPGSTSQLPAGSFPFTYVQPFLVAMPIFYSAAPNEELIQGFTLGLSLSESSTNPFSLLGYVVTSVEDPPAP